MAENGVWATVTKAAGPPYRMNTGAASNWRVGHKASSKTSWTSKDFCRLTQALEQCCQARRGCSPQPTEELLSVVVEDIVEAMRTWLCKYVGASTGLPLGDRKLGKCSSNASSDQKCAPLQSAWSITGSS